MAHPFEGTLSLRPQGAAQDLSNVDPATGRAALGAASTEHAISHETGSDKITRLTGPEGATSVHVSNRTLFNALAAPVLDWSGADLLIGNGASRNVTIAGETVQVLSALETAGVTVNNSGIAQMFGTEGVLINGLDHQADFGSGPSINAPSGGSIVFDSIDPYVTVNGVTFEGATMNYSGSGFTISTADTMWISAGSELTLEAASQPYLNLNSVSGFLEVFKSVRAVVGGNTSHVIGEFAQAAAPAAGGSTTITAVRANVELDLTHAGSIASHTFSIFAWLDAAPVGAELVISSQSAITTVSWTTTGYTIRNPLPTAFVANGVYVIKKIAATKITRVV